MNIWKSLAMSVILAGLFLASGGVRAEEIDNNFACRDAADVERFYTATLSADQNQDTNTILEQTVLKDGLSKSCVVGDADSFEFKQALGGKGDMSVVIYTDPATKLTMSLIGFSPMDQDTPATSVIMAATTPLMCEIVNKNQLYTCIHKDGCSCPVE